MVASSRLQLVRLISFCASAYLACHATCNQQLARFYAKGPGRAWSCAVSVLASRPFVCFALTKMPIRLRAVSMTSRGKPALSAAYLRPSDFREIDGGAVFV